MKTMIKYFLGLTLMVCFGFSVLGQESSYGKPPRQENTYLFEVLKYDRQPAPPTYMDTRISQIIENPMSEWTAQDSLYYAYESVYLEKFDLALSIFARLNVDTIKETHAQELYRITLQMSGRYEALKKYNEKTLSDNPSAFYSVKDAFMDLNEAYIAYKNKSFITDSTLIFPILKDPALEEMKRNASPNKNKLVQIAFAIDSAFRQFTTLHDEKDYILSQAFEEMGDFQKEYFYITNAYFYYSASRQYYKNDKEVSKKYNQAINEMTDKNYLSISFKNKFGKVIKNRYQLEDNYIEEAKKGGSNATRAYSPPPKKKVQKDYLPWIDNSILIMIIIALALTFVLIFMRVKK
jgi:hypothetical protein